MGRGGPNIRGRIKVNDEIGIVRLEDTERAAKATKMRYNGATLPMIVDELGYADQATARRAIQRHMRRTVMSEEAIQLRHIEYERLEQVHRVALRGMLEDRDPEMMRIILKASDQRAKLTGINVNEALQAGASAVSAVADLAAASMLQASLIGVLHEEGLPVEQIERIIGRLNDRMGASAQAEDEGEVVSGEVVD